MPEPLANFGDAAHYSVVEDPLAKAPRLSEIDIVLMNATAETGRTSWQTPRIEVLNIDATANGVASHVTEITPLAPDS